MNECLMSIKVNNRSANDYIRGEIHSDENTHFLTNYTLGRKGKRRLSIISFSSKEENEREINLCE